MTFRALMLLGICSVATCFSGQAWAQEAMPKEPVAQDGSSSDMGVQDIIVSARRRSETLQNTPIAITAISTDQLESTRSLNITDLQGVAPNLLITSNATGAAAANISIRGIAFADVDKSFDPAVGVMVDGVYIGTSTGQVLDFFDIESIEVLRGPQGTLFGRNTIGGVINVRRTRPTLDWGGKFQASYGSYNQWDLRATINVPIVEDVLGVKFFEFHQESDGYYRLAPTGERVGATNSENFGASVLYEPSSSFDALLTLEQQNQRWDPLNGSLISPDDVFCPFVPAGACGGNNTTDIYTVYSKPNFFGEYRARAATLEMNADAGPMKITSITSYRESREAEQQDFGTAGVYDALRNQKYHQLSQEIRFAGNLGSNLDYVAGLYYFSSKYHLIQITNNAISGDTTGKSESEAAFVDLNWEIAPEVRLSGGGRYTHDTKQNINPLLYPGPAKESWNNFSPKLSIDYRPNDALMVYASWSKGYRSGGFSGRGQTAFSAQTPYDPEKVSVYELGLKSQLLNRKLVFNIAGFYTDYKDMQQNTTISADTAIGNETIVVNASGSKIKGIEADFTAKATKNFTITGSIGLTDAKLNGFIIDQPYFGVNRTFDFSKVNLIFAPNVTASIAGDYEVPLSDRTTLNFHAGYRYISHYDQQVAADPATVAPATGTIIVERNDPRLVTDRQNAVDLSATLQWDVGSNGARARATAFVRNLLDDRGMATGFTVTSFPTLWGFTAAREPRIFGGQIGFEF